MNTPGISPKGSDRLANPKGVEKNDQGLPEKLTVFEQALLLDPSHFADIYMQFLLSGVSLDQQGQGVFISKAPAAGEEPSTDDHLEAEKVDLSTALPPTAAGELAASSSDVTSATVSSAITLTDFANTKGALDTGINTEAKFATSFNATNSFEPALAQTIQTQTVPLSALSDLIPTPTAPAPAPALVQTNAPAILGSASVGLAETNAPLSTSGVLSISDVDSPATFTIQANVAGSNGVFNLAADGAWTYVANSAFDSLNVGQSLSDTFTVQSSDGTATSVTVTINGSNDAAILSSATVPLTETNAALSTGGTLTVSDVDNPATFVAQTGTVGNHGVFSIAADGAWTYVANGAFNNLNVGESVSDPFTVQSSDGTTTSVTVTINGSNDAAVLSSATVPLTETNAPLSTSGTLTISDVDSPATFVAQSNVVGTAGVFNIASNGAWTFVANSAFNNLNVGQSVNNTFNVQSSDGTASTVTVTINGTNDAPVAQVDFAGSVLEGKILTNPVNVLNNDTDVDNSSLSVAQLAQNAAGTGAIAVNGINTITTALGGTILMNANGTYTYTAPTSLDHSSNDTLVDSFFYKTSDGSSQSAWTQVSINVNDTAPIAVSDVDNVGFGGLVYGNVITGGGGNGSGADTLGADSTRVSSVTYNGTTYSNFADVILSAGGASTLASWTNNGVQVLGYNLDAGVFGAAVTPGVRSNYGLFIDSPGGSDDSNEIDSNSTTQTEAIALNLGANYRSMQVTFRDIQSDDQIAWKAYDSNQVLVDSGVINNTANGTGARAEASFTITSSAAFQYIAFSGTDATDDFTLWSISNATPAVSNPSLTINADHGTFVFYQNGGYTYQSTEALTSAGGGTSLSNWTSGGIQVLGYNLGAPIFGASVVPTFRSGYGLFINSPGNADDSNELDSTSTTQTETIALNMGSDYRSLQVTFRDVQADDQIAWKAYNSSQVLVDSGVINNTAIGSGSANEASFTITPNGAFRYIAFSGTDANDNFTLWSISNGVKVLSSDVFSYTLTDADNDTSSANLSIAHQGTVTAVADVNNVYESGLSTGTDPGHADIVVSGNLFSNDDGLSGTSSITQVTFNSTTATPTNGVLSIDTPQGLLTVYTTTAYGHIQGDYQYTLQAAGDPLNEAFTYRITDSATGRTSDSTLTVNIADDVHVLTGTASAETLTGGNYTDFIDANGGNDTLFGGLGPDTLIGGQGSDTMTGGGGQDTFTWKGGDNLGSPTDTINDFAKGVGGDVLDLSQLLTGESQTAQSLDSYLNFNYNNSSNATVVSVNPEGGATFNVTQTIVLAGVDLTAGGTLQTDQDILTTLINNGNLKTD
jgi:VCBS repeat-containing protein